MTGIIYRPASNDCINISCAEAGCRFNNLSRNCSASCAAICWIASLLSSVTVYIHWATNRKVSIKICFHQLLFQEGIIKHIMLSDNECIVTYKRQGFTQSLFLPSINHVNRLTLSWPSDNFHGLVEPVFKKQDGSNPSKNLK